MRLWALLFTAILCAAPARAQQAPASPAEDTTANLPVSLARIKDALKQGEGVPPLKLDATPTFRVQIRERQKIEELLATLNFSKHTYVPSGGVAMQEQQRLMFNPVDNPLVQPYAAFNQGELLTILIENLAGHYLAGKASDAISKAERARAEAQARDDVRVAVADYCNAQPNAGAGLQICSSVGR